MRFTRGSAFALLAALALGCGSEIEPNAGGLATEIAEVSRTLAMSATHTCALREAGLYCWGDNFNGELGTGNTTETSVPVAATVAGEDIVDVAARYGRTCVRRSTGEVACWGANEQGQLGNGTREPALTAVSAAGVNDAVQLAIDDGTSCVLHATRRVSCWGGSFEGAPGVAYLKPTLIEGLEGVVELRGGILDTYCARGAAGWTRCFRLQEGVWSTPQELEPLAGARGIALTGHDEVCAITEASDMACHNLESKSTVPLANSEGLIEIVGTSLVTCGRSEHAGWKCWNILPPLLESVGSEALQVPSEVPLIELALGGLNVCALREDRGVVCGSATDAVPALRPVEGLPP